MRTRMVSLLLGVVVAALALALPAGAQDDHDDDVGATTTPTSTPEGVGIEEGLFVSGAVITPLAGGATRTMDAYDAAVFVQSWLGAAFFGNPGDAQDPPPELPVYRIDASGTWGGNPGNVTAYYATDGTTPYIAFSGLEVWTDPTAVPPPSDWFVPPARVIDAFNGEGELIDTFGVGAATSTTGEAPTPDGGAASEPGGSGSDASLWPWIGAAGAIAAVGAGGLWVRRRRA